MLFWLNVFKHELTYLSTTDLPAVLVSVSESLSSSLTLTVIRLGRRVVLLVTDCDGKGDGSDELAVGVDAVDDNDDGDDDHDDDDDIGDTGGAAVTSEDVYDDADTGCDIGAPPAAKQDCKK